MTAAATLPQNAEQKAMGKRMFRIWISGGHADVEEFPCASDEAHLGKAEDNLTVLQGWTVSPHHAAISRDRGGLYVHDLGRGRALR